MSDSPSSGQTEHEPGLPLPIEVTATIVGEYRWIENALYHLLGRWSGTLPIAAVRLHLDSQSMRHAWHAELWGDRLPVRDGTDPDAFSLPSQATATLFSALGDEIGSPLDDQAGSVGPADEEWEGASDDGDAGAPGALPRLAALYRVVLPRLVTTYELHLAGTMRGTDGPVARALTLVLNDEREDWRSGERLLERIVVRPHDVAACYGFLERLESAVVATGVGPGLIMLPEVLRAG